MLVATIPFALWRDLTLWRLIELKMELLIQCVPAFLIALHWSRLRAGPVFAGIVVGTVFSAGLSLSGVTRLEGVHVGVVGCALNAVVAILGSLRPTDPAPRSLAPDHRETSL
jgi:Na+/proline symporter